MSPTVPDAGNAADALEVLIYKTLASLPPDPGDAIKLIDDGFVQLDAFRERPDHSDACAVLEGMRKSRQAILELRKRNWGASQNLFAESERLLSSAAKFGDLARMLSDASASDAFFLSGMLALQQLDVNQGELLIRQAARKAEDFAQKYTEPGDEINTFYLALAKLQRANLRFWKCLNALTRMDFVEGARLGDPIEAEEACAALSRLALDPDRRILLTQAQVFSKSLAPMRTIAQVVGALLRNETTPKVDYSGQRQLLEDALEAAAEAGPDALNVLINCKQIIGMFDTVRQIDSLRPKPPQPDGIIRVFVMMKFSEAEVVIEEALREVFENEPYWFQVVLARDEILEGDLFDNVRKLMERADAFIADVSDLNPNVMIELGMAINDARRRPVLLIRRTDGVPMPSDLKERLYGEYQLQDPEKRSLDVQLRTAFQKTAQIADLQVRRSARFLSRRWIEKAVRAKDPYFQISKQQILTLQRQYVSVERLQSATVPEIATHVGSGLANLLAEALRPVNQSAGA